MEAKMIYLLLGLRRFFIARLSPPLLRESFIVFINLDDEIYFVCGAEIASLRYAVLVCSGPPGRFERNTYFESRQSSNSYTLPSFTSLTNACEGIIPTVFQCAQQFPHRCGRYSLDRLFEAWRTGGILVLLYDWKG